MRGVRSTDWSFFCFRFVGSPDEMAEAANRVEQNTGKRLKVLPRSRAGKKGSIALRNK